MALASRNALTRNDPQRRNAGTRMFETVLSGAFSDSRKRAAMVE